MTHKLVILLLLISISTSAQKKNKQQSLFDGKDLAGWTVYGTEKWYVQDKEIICESGPDKQYGYLATDKEYKDFELVVQFKQEANGNSGIFFHCSIEGTKISGWQAEVAPMNQHTGGIYESYGRGWLIQPEASKEKFLKEGDWNVMKVVIKGGHVETFLNGVQMVSIVDAKISESKGKIALQIHDGGGVKVRWRELFIKEL